MHESWKPCPHFETTHEVSDHGRVRSLPRVVHTAAGKRVVKGRILKLDHTHQNGYARVCLTVNNEVTKKTVHSLVARAFLGAPPGPVGSKSGEWTVDHVDGDKTNNRVDNLEWVTSDENRRRYVARGTIKRGAAHPNAKLTRADVVLMRRLYDTGEHTQRVLAERFGVNGRRVSEIVRRAAWKHVA